MSSTSEETQSLGRGALLRPVNARGTMDVDTLPISAHLFPYSGLWKAHHFWLAISTDKVECVTPHLLTCILMQDYILYTC